MKILHILTNSQSKISKEIIDVQSKDNEIKVIELSKKEISYEDIIDEIFSHDKVISW